MKIKLIFLIFILTYFSSSFVFAENTNFNLAVNAANQLGKKNMAVPVNEAKAFDPSMVYDHYTKNPPETNYYVDTTAKNTNAMNTAAASAENTGVGGNIIESVKLHPQYDLSQQDKSVQQGTFLLNEADHIIHGVTDQYVDCQPQNKCTTQYTMQSCEEAATPLFQLCHQTLTVTVTTHTTVTHYLLKAHLLENERDYAGVSVNAVSGIVSFLGPYTAHFSLSGRLPNNMDCKTLSGSIQSSTGTTLDYLHFPSCSNGLTLDFHFSHGHSVDVTIDMASTTTSHETEDHWIDDCNNLASDTACHFQNKSCDQGKSRRIVQGVPVTRDCWQYQDQYLCRKAKVTGDCAPLVSQGCEQVSSLCTEKNADSCLSFTQTFRCAKTTCSATGAIRCGDGKDYCLTGNCTDHAYAPSQDFGKSASSLIAANDAAKNLDPNSLEIFTGYAATCSEKPVGYSNCCAEKGWGEHLGLDHCSNGEKKLHTSRSNKLAIYVGRVCSGPDPFPCLEHSQVYCVFDSKLAKIIEEQGRKNQLHIGFGSAKTPNCHGITADQLQAINFSTIDFSDYVSDLKNQITDLSETDIEAKIKQDVTNQVNASAAHE